MYTLVHQLTHVLFSVLMFYRCRSNTLYAFVPEYVINASRRFRFCRHYCCIIMFVVARIYCHADTTCMAATRSSASQTASSFFSLSSHVPLETPFADVTFYNNDDNNNVAKLHCASVRPTSDYGPMVLGSVRLRWSKTSRLNESAIGSLVRQFSYRKSITLGVVMDVVMRVFRF